MKSSHEVIPPAAARPLLLHSIRVGVDAQGGCKAQGQVAGAVLATLVVAHLTNLLEIDSMKGQGFQWAKIFE